MKIRGRSLAVGASPQRAMVSPHWIRIVHLDAPLAAAPGKDAKPVITMQRAWKPWTASWSAKRSREKLPTKASKWNHELVIFGRIHSKFLIRHRDLHDIAKITQSKNTNKNDLQTLKNHVTLIRCYGGRNDAHKMISKPPKNHILMRMCWTVPQHFCSWPFAYKSWS